ncbi:MAG: phosphoribosylformylglycinamidine synthase subunit PurS [Rhodospirillaceae bacterium]|nr:phosphoribosylformylglycinamidine synthase subunit PurS [Rhodospirillaceae bacterium]
MRVHVVPREGVLDPQGQAVAGGLKNLGFEGLTEVRVGTVIDVTLDREIDREAATKLGTDMSEALLANPVTEDFEIEIL